MVERKSKEKVYKEEFMKHYSDINKKAIDRLYYNKQKMID